MASCFFGGRWHIVVHENKGRWSCPHPRPLALLAFFLQAPSHLLSAIRALHPVSSNSITNSKYCTSDVTTSVGVLCQLIKSSVRPNDVAEATPFLKVIN